MPCANRCLTFGCSTHTHLGLQYTRCTHSCPVVAVCAPPPQAHLLLPWLWELVHHPRVVGAVQQALGGCRNVLCWSTDIFSKEPGGGGYTSWHQDSTYVGE